MANILYSKVLKGANVLARNRRAFWGALIKYVSLMHHTLYHGTSRQAAEGGL